MHWVSESLHCALPEILHSQWVCFVKCRWQLHCPRLKALYYIDFSCGINHSVNNTVCVFSFSFVIIPVYDLLLLTYIHTYMYIHTWWHDMVALYTQLIYQVHNVLQTNCHFVWESVTLGKLFSWVYKCVEFLIQSIIIIDSNCWLVPCQPTQLHACVCVLMPNIDRVWYCHNCLLVVIIFVLYGIMYISMNYYILNTVPAGSL